MAKVQYRNLSKQQRELLETSLLETLQNLHLNKHGCRLVRSLLTKSEVTMLARRILIARMLLRGYTFSKIESELKAVPNTIRSVDRWIEEQFPAYRRALFDLRDRERQQEKKAGTDRSLYAPSDIRKLYPDHADLFFILLGNQ